MTWDRVKSRIARIGGAPKMVDDPCSCGEAFWPCGCIVPQSTILTARERTAALKGKRVPAFVVVADPGPREA